MCCLCVNVNCHRVTTHLQLINIYHIILVFPASPQAGHVVGSMMGSGFSFFWGGNIYCQESIHNTLEDK